MQKRVAPASDYLCKDRIPKMVLNQSRDFTNSSTFSCYPRYTSAFKDKATITNSTALDPRYPELPGCFMYHDNHETASWMHPNLYYGRHQTYGPAGHGCNILFDRNPRVLFQNLRSAGWIDQATRMVALELILYNPNTDIFLTMRLMSEFLPTGGITPQSEVRVCFGENWAVLIRFVPFVSLSSLFVVKLYLHSPSFRHVNDTNRL